MTDDEATLAALHLAAARDPVPGHVSRSAREVYRLRVAGAVTARRVPVPPGSGARSAPPADGQALRYRFAADGLVVDLEVAACGGLIELAGRVTPHPGPGGRVEIRTFHDTHPRPLPATGQFAASGLPPGWYSVVCHRPDGPPVATRWTRLRP
ncbi:hypothetical protein [Spongiactinospora sp. TRM90649]|uniref:hypothetical protein n=1 Tax=Spongiactinospora sp. TRM90649 TaxID=3031114 RepID=UPI0023F6C384|nr:hypothetical protein [Spongiactinospora sp. TRM90649]MDF5755405.1 hypothetical protein [Spongiactinospora sp. TRM90649]